MRVHALIVLAAALASGGWLLYGDEPPPDKPASYWMEKKLEYSEKLLRGLSTEDYDTIGKTARTMNALSQMEKWVRGSVPEYRAQLHIFKNANERLIRAADQQNLDGAALAYVQLTLSCVNCHKVVRDLNRSQPSAQ